MKSILIHKTDAMQSPGGGEVQLLETAAALARLGVETEVCAVDTLKNQPVEADVYHFFGTVDEFLPAIRRLSREGHPCLVSTIAWYDPRAYWHEAGWLASRVAAVSRFTLRAAMPWLPSWRKRLYQTASLLLPNSEAEARQLRRYFGVPSEKIHIVPNGVDPRFFIAPADRTEEGVENLARRLCASASSHAAFDLSKAVLCVGRFEPRKNQLGLIRAMRKTNHPLLFIGGPVPGHEAYYQTCRKEAPEKALFLGPIDHHDPALAQAYAGCACLALPSRFETPGLVALEAALTGTPLVLTRRGCTQEYFGDLAEYVSPDDAEEIRVTVAHAIARGRRPELIEHVLSRFTWDKAAETTRAAYEAALPR